MQCFVACFDKVMKRLSFIQGNYIIHILQKVFGTFRLAGHKCRQADPFGNNKQNMRQ